MDLKIPSAIVDRQIFPKQTKRTEIWSVAMIAVVSHVLMEVCGIQGCGEQRKPVGDFQGFVRLREAEGTERERTSSNLLTDLLSLLHLQAVHVHHKLR